MSIGDTFSSAIPSGSVVGLIFLLIIVGSIVLVIFGGLALVIWQKKKWNLKVEIKLPRSDGRLVNGEWGKGYFHSKRGVVYIKRPGFMQPKIPLKIFDPKRYLQGADLITVVQLSPVDYRPVLPDSFLKHEVEFVCDKDYGGGHSFIEKLNFSRDKDEQIETLKKGDVVMVKESVLNIKCDTGHSKAWEQAFDAASKQAYSLKSFMQQFQTPIAVAIVLVAVFVGIAALWTQMP